MSDQQSFREIWDAVKEEMHQSGKFSESTLNLWFSDTEITMMTDTRVVLMAKSTFKRDVIKKNYSEELAKQFHNVLGFPVEVEIRAADSEKRSLEELRKESGIKEDKSKEIESFLLESTVSPATRDEEEPNYYSTVGDSRVLNYAQVSRNMNFEYTFDTFIVGSSNKFAYAACLAVANEPSLEYNPLFIYSAPGLGKTHLLYAIIDRIRTNHPHLNIVYVKGEAFTTQMIDSISRNRASEFRERYRKSDVLLIDDIQFIAGKEATQEEFFHTFNDLYENHKQIILTSDRPPRDIQTLEDRLKSRFEWGLMADIKAPDFELRTAILKNKAESLRLKLPDDVLNYLAENLKQNVRQLEGAVKKIAAQSFLSGLPITVDLTIGCVADLITPSEPVSVTVDKIIEQVSRHYGISVDDMKSKKRNASIAKARHTSIYMIRKLTDMSLPAIAKIFNRDHTTIMASLDKVEAEIKSNPTVDIEIKELFKSVKE